MATTGSSAPAQLQHFIDGRWTPASTDEVLTVRDPATGEPVATAPVGGASDVDAAVGAARKAAAEWARVAPAERAGALRAAAAALRARAGEVARLVTREMGKPLADAEGGVLAGAATLEQYAELGPLHRGRSLQGAWGATDLMVHEPRGVAAVITPWNDPVAIACGLIGACLVTGNAVVLKPSERTPASAGLLVECFDVPPGVLGLVHGAGEAGAALAGDPRLDLVCFVGSLRTGREIAGQCARTGAKPLLELGGKDPLIVDAGVDPAWAAEQAAIGAFANAGQICTSVERIYVHADVAEPFVEALVARAEALVMGNGLDPATTLGPLVDRRARTAVHAQVTDAVAGGAELRTGGRVPDGPGAHYPATVLTGCTREHAVMREETFGPVAPVQVVGSFDEALAEAAETAYGLAAVVLTRDMGHAQRAWRELPVGTVKVNAVFGGAPGGAAEPHGGSGRGFGYGPELLDEVTTTKVVHCAPYPID
ncbi:MAG: aldehyde dehydrogenase family protein [Frankiaceae bacterium]